MRKIFLVIIAFFLFFGSSFAQLPRFQVDTLKATHKIVIWNGTQWEEVTQYEGDVTNRGDATTILNNGDTTLSVNPDTIDARAGKVVDDSGTISIVGQDVKVWDHVQNNAIVNVKDKCFNGGAKGDGSTNDRAAIHEAIDSAATLVISEANGATVFFPYGTYMTGGTIYKKSGITLYGPPSGRRGQAARIKMMGDTTGHVIADTTTDSKGGGVVNLQIFGGASSRGTTGNGAGIYFEDVTKGIISNVFIRNVYDQAILLGGGTGDKGGATIINNAECYNTIWNRNRTEITGCLQIEKDHDDVRVRDCEFQAGTAAEDSLISSDMYVTAVVVKSSNCFFVNTTGEISDRGFYVESKNNSFVGCRADLNYGHGWYNAGANIFTGCRSVNNGRDADTTYSGFYHYSGAATYTGCFSFQQDYNIKHHFYDYENNPSQGARFSNSYVWDISSLKDEAIKFEARTDWLPGGFDIPFKWFEMDETDDTLNVDLRTGFLWSGTSDMTLKLFKNGYSGQIVTIHTYDTADTLTIQNNTKIKTLSGSDLKLNPKSTVDFMNVRDVWYEKGKK